MPMGDWKCLKLTGPSAWHSMFDYYYYYYYYYFFYYYYCFFFLLWHKTGVMSWLYKQSSTASLKLQHLKKAGAFYCRFNVFFLLITYKLKNDLWYGKRDISASAAVSRCQNRKLKHKPIISRTVSGLKGVHVPVDKQDGGSMRPLCLKKWHKT